MAYFTRAVTQRKGDEPALADETGATTWAQFDARVNRLVHALRARELETGDTVALLCGNRREFFEVMLAGMHTGLVKAPKTIDFEERLPRSPTGKLHKRLLRAPYWQGTGRRI